MGNASHSHHGYASMNASKVCMFKEINVTNRENNYDTHPGDHSNGKVVNYPSTSIPPPSSNPLPIEKPTFDAVLRQPNNTIRKGTFNPNSCTTQNYNIVEDLA
jgi:hypothetical protein